MPEYDRNASLDELLEDVRRYLAPAEELVRADLRSGSDTARPVVFLHGAHRCGSTLFLQWLASSGMVAYPTNLLSRFHATPLVGARIQQLIADPRYAFRDELADLQAGTNYESANGKTRGALGPNEFWYFWRRFLPDRERDYFPDDELRRAGHLDALRDELGLLTRIYARPFALKAMIMNQGIPALAAAVPHAIFVHIHRDPVFNIQSALEARKRQFGDLTSWYSFRIREYSELAELEPLRAVAGQIAAIRRSIEVGFESVPAERRLDVPYESFCRDPAAYGRAIASLLGGDDAGLCYDPARPEDAFESTNRWRLEEYTQTQVEREWERMDAWAREQIG